MRDVVAGALQALGDYLTGIVIGFGLAVLVLAVMILAALSALMG